MNVVTSLDKQSLDESQLSSLSILEYSLEKKIEETNEAFSALNNFINQLYYVTQLTKELQDVTLPNQIMTLPANRGTDLSFLCRVVLGNFKDSKKLFDKLLAKVQEIIKKDVI